MKKKHKKSTSQKYQERRKENRKEVAEKQREPQTEIVRTALSLLACKTRSCFSASKDATRSFNE